MQHLCPMCVCFTSDGREALYPQNCLHAHLKDVPAVGPVPLVDRLVGVPELVAGEVVRGVALVTGYVGSGGVQKDEEDGEEDGGQRGKCGKVLPHFGYCNARVSAYGIDN